MPRPALSSLPLLTVLAILGAATPVARAELIPAARLVDWTPGISVGVPGGIPNDRTHIIDVSRDPYNADKTGATDASVAIQTAINAAVSGDVIYLPAGTYLCRNPLTTGYKSGISIRGSGESTVINSTVGGSVFLQIGGGSDYNWSWPSTGNVVTGGLGKGSTQLTLADTSAFNVGQLIHIGMDNNPAIPVVSVFGYQGMQRQMSRVTAKSASTLTISPALYGDYSATRTVVHVAQFQANFVGLEHLVIDMSQSTATFGVWLEQCYGCWVQDVHVRKSANYHVFLNDSLACEVRHCNLDELNHVGSNGAGILCNTISGCLIEDNIIYKAFPLIEVNHGSSGNVFAYNLCEDSSPGVAIDSNHGPHNAYNLYEGNIAPNLQSDGYFGSASDDTIFRNWFHGILNGSMGWTLSLNRFTREYSVVGNIFQKAGYTLSADGVSLGNPNMGNSSYSGTAPPWPDSAQTGAGTLSQNGTNIATTAPMFSPANVGWFIMTPSTSVLNSITAYTDAQHVTVNNSQTLSGTSYILTPGPGGYQELDTGVASTIVRKANFYYVYGRIPDAEAPGTDAVPASLFRAQKPAWFGNLAWPAFDATQPNPSYESIPAGYRYLHGVDPTVDPNAGTTASTSTTLQQKPINVRISK